MTVGTEPAADTGRWGPRLLAALAIGLCIAAITAWVQVFYLRVSLNVILSHLSYDAPRLSTYVVQSSPIIGDHYFGDLQEGLNWGRLILEDGISPYEVGANYFPASIVLMLPLSLLPSPAVVYVVLAALAVSILVPAWLLLGGMRTTDRILALCLAGILTAPFLATLDRGNLQGLVIGAIAAALWAASTRRWTVAAALLAVAISLKGYPVVLLVVPVALGYWRYAAKIAIAAIACWVSILVVTPGGLFTNLGDLKSNFAAPVDSLYVSRNHSFAGMLGQAVSQIEGRPLVATSIVVVVCSSLWLALMWLLVRAAVVPEWCWGALALASLQVVLPSASPYAASWAIFAAVWFIRGTLLPAEVGRVRLPRRSPSDRQVTLLRITLLGSIVVSLTPVGWALGSVYGFNVVAFLSPLLVALAGVVALVVSIRPSGPAASLAGSSTSPSTR